MYHYNTGTDLICSTVSTLNDCRGLIDLANTFTNMVDNDITVHENSHQLSTTAHLHKYTLSYHCSAPCGQSYPNDITD